MRYSRFRVWAGIVLLLLCLTGDVVLLMDGGGHAYTVVVLNLLTCSVAVWGLRARLKKESDGNG